MRMLMSLIVGAMVASIVGILSIKPFERGSDKNDTPPAIIQQPEPK